MDLLKKAILEKGTVKGADILKVDAFLNHQLDVDLLNEIGKEFYRRFKDSGVTKILTIEASGIAIAVIAAQYFKVPVVFAKKVESKNLDGEMLEADVYSFTKDKEYKIRVSKKFISEGDNVLVIDDFLAMGRAALGLKKIVEDASANLVGVGIVIEKSFQEGPKVLKESGTRVESLAMIEKFEDGKPIFK